MSYIEQLERKLSKVIAWTVYHRGKFLGDEEWDELYSLLNLKLVIEEEVK